MWSVAMLVLQANPVGFECFCWVNNFFCPSKFVYPYWPPEWTALYSRCIGHDKTQTADHAGCEDRLMSRRCADHDIAHDKTQTAGYGDSKTVKQRLSDKQTVHTTQVVQTTQFFCLFFFKIVLHMIKVYTPFSYSFGKLKSNFPRN